MSRSIESAHRKYEKVAHVVFQSRGIQAFCPDFLLIKSFGDALASPAPLPPTQVSLSVKGASKRMS